ncbi:MAG: tRNA adenosine(34) deaminase TadA [Elusimicrobia bacterium]|nr:tRNA adenosine(34) deaminase TadA [Elusimicrobiota bacterium]MBD3411923.1 tRNA adenosine(34) deaminase TadA [Elusimicrobiota bacterium]
MSTHDARFMTEALIEARKALKNNEVPVGAVVVKNNRIIARAYNQNIRFNDPSAHAEIIALKKTGKHLKNHRLHGCTVYVTIEPCVMCAGAMVHARIKKVVFGAYDPKTGACGSVFNIPGSEKLNHRLMVVGGALEKECSSVIRDFFKKRRKT